MTEYRRERPRRPWAAGATPGTRRPSCPWFVRNVLIKVLIVAKLGRFTRLLGHAEPTWPF